jgi:hypothetical protein
MKYDDQKKFTPPLGTDSYFFTIPLSILEQSIRKAAAGAVCAFGIRIADYTQ